MPSLARGTNKQIRREISLLGDQLPPSTAPALRRSLGVVGVLLLTLSVATPASSVFVIVPGMLQVAGSGALAAMLFAAIVCVATAFIYAELSSAWPVAGGEYVMVARTLGPCAGFVMLGVNVFNNLLFPPVAALGVATVLATIAPGLPPAPTAAAVMIAATLLGLLNVRVNAAVTGAFFAIEAAALIIIVVLGALRPVRDLGAMLMQPIAALGSTLVPASPASIGVATSIAIFALNGYGAAVYFGEEMHEAPARIAQAILLALVATLMMEMLPLAAALAGVPDLRSFLVSDDPFGVFVAIRGGATVSALVAVGVVVAIVNAVIAGILATARFFYATARDASWGRPLDIWLAGVHPRTASPVGATLLSGGVGLAACFVQLRILLVLSGAGLVAIYIGITAAVVVGRHRGITAHARYRMPLYPMAPIVAALALGYVVWLSWLDPEEGRLGLIVTAVQIVGSAVYYGLVLQPRGWSASLR